jgi:CheY-like chemotaxis protein
VISPSLELEAQSSRGQIMSDTTPYVDWSKKTVLVAEDDRTHYMLLEEIIVNQSKARILHVEDGVMALEFFKNHPEINLIIMDLKMPIMDGFTATQEIRKLNKEIPIIALSAYALEDDKHKAYEAGCSAYLSKPYEINTLINLLAKFP